MVNALLEVQEALDAIDTRGDYAQKVLLLCIRCGMPEALETLLQRPFVRQVARIADSNGMNALHHAAQQGHRGVVGLLLRALPAGDIMRANRAGKHAVDLAKEGGHGEVFMLIAAAALVSGAGEKH
jgi:ankyrin repeat protein